MYASSIASNHDWSVNWVPATLPINTRAFSINHDVDKNSGRWKKIILLDELRRSDFADLIEEVSALAYLRHPNLIQLLSVRLNKSSIELTMPLYDLGSLDRYISALGLREPLVAHIISQVMEGLVYLHLNRYIHFGIRGKHVLLSSSGQVAITGFKNFYRGHSTYWNVEDVAWLSPEILSQGNDCCCFNSDVYSAGLLAAFSFTGKMPYDGDEHCLILLKKIRGIDKPSLFDRNDGLPPSDEFVDFFENCCHDQASNRLESCDAVNHKFLAVKDSINPQEYLSEIRSLRPS